MTFVLLAVSVLVLVAAVLISVLVVVLVLIVVLGTVVILLIHVLLPSSLIFAVFRYSSMPVSLGFILCFEDNGCQESEKDGGCDPACGGLQPTGEDPEEALFGDCLPDSLCQGISKSG